MGSEHGGLNYRELRKKGINPDDVLDFSVSINPDPLPEEVLQAVRNANVTRYPDTDSSLLREIISAFYGVDEKNILILNGTSQGMFLVVSALLPPRGKVLIAGPTYGEYRDACRLKTDHIHEIRMKAEDGYAFPLDEILDFLEFERPDLFWLCSPNNPTGSYLDESSFEKIQKSCRDGGTLFLLDEAYACFVDDRLRYNSLRESVVVLRSMTKDFSIPGLRLGYLMAATEIIEKLRRWQPDWSISAPAQNAGIAGFARIDYFKESWRKTVERREDFRDALLSLGLHVVESCANFFLVKIDDVEALKRSLWKELILVRDCHSFGLTGYIRIGVRSEEDNIKLISCLREYLEG